MKFEVKTLGDYYSREKSERRWVWKNRIPVGKVTLVSGDWGAGKTHSIASVITHVLRQEEFPDGEMPGEEPGDVLIITTESDADELVEVFKAQGCEREELERIHVLGWVEDSGRKLIFDIDRNMEVLESEIQRWKPLFIVFDPLIQYHSRKDIDTHSIRGLMVVLDTLCAKWHVSMLAMIHWNKNEKLSSANRTAGSHQYAAGVKAMVSVERDVKDKAKRYFHQSKMNLGPDPVELAFEIQKPDGLVVWDKVKDVEPSGKVAEAERWLMANLQECPESIKDCYEKSGYNERTLRRARHNLGHLIITTEKRTGREGQRQTFWEVANERNLWGVFKIETREPSGEG